MPYAYVERYAFESFTGPTTAITLHPEQVEPEWRDCIRLLERDERDVDGKLLKPGTRVLCHPLQPEACREDNPANRQEFLRLDRTWTPQTRQRVWFPSLFALPEKFSSEADACRSAKDAFLSAVDENMASAKRQPIPQVNSLPFWFGVLAWEPKIKEVTEVANLTDQLVDRLVDKSGMPREVAWTDEWRECLAALCGLKIYALSGVTVNLHVIAAVPACLHFQAPGQPSFFPPSQETIDIVHDVYKQWSHRSGRSAEFAFFCDALQALQDSGHYRIYRTSEGVLAVGRKTSTVGKTVTAARFRSRMLVRLACLAPAIGVGIWFVKDLILGRPSDAWAIAAIILMTYGGEWLNTRLSRWREDKED
jgi:hypothetical protein